MASTPAEAVLLLFSIAFQAGKALAALPFDTLRVARANAVKAGMVENSMLASGDFERRVGRLERMILGPMARRV